ncbi:hypothetical protein PsorP6_011391 [Peronosclerospora sorghi]|uniref:Uncharacterized protein n=1 Tax=Peronosclerospora sorghi TaxID=230839 RepID=A0ACC0WL38_9STRA|nr:hypothetical protein PsorP6_011391 [Peronosclerospora sorghi]
MTCPIAGASSSPSATISSQSSLSQSLRSLAWGEREASDFQNKNSQFSYKRMVTRKQFKQQGECVVMWIGGESKSFSHKLKTEHPTTRVTRARYCDTHACNSSHVSNVSFPIAGASLSPSATISSPSSLSLSLRSLEWGEQEALDFQKKNSQFSFKWMVTSPSGNERNSSSDPNNVSEAHGGRETVVAVVGEMQTYLSPVEVNLQLGLAMVAPSVHYRCRNLTTGRCAPCAAARAKGSHERRNQVKKWQGRGARIGFCTGNRSVTPSSEMGKPSSRLYLRRARFTT